MPFTESLLPFCIQLSDHIPHRVMYFETIDPGRIKGKSVMSVMLMLVITLVHMVEQRSKAGSGDTS